MVVVAGRAVLAYPRPEASVGAVAHRLQAAEVRPALQVLKALAFLRARRRP